VGAGPFIFDETQSSSPEAEVSELYEDFDRALSNEDFLSRDLAALTSIARNHKRALAKVIEGR
jgi:hypothetical protein